MPSIAKKTRQTAKETGSETIVQVKGNQKTLLQDCLRIAETTPPTEVYQEPLTKVRNRLESRQVELFENSLNLDKVLNYVGIL
jgi:hypothetical protein